ncbi:hypothetical protein STAFG_0856 [Streptomyces afghaniensis 772]|uniref:PPM-type phosphatase domain-containing protein n=1 Tax=Streptomyces afghaniensis 772 TaxID=1283301 RepID=S4NUG2_9ACTN|nr:hypothetical protein STAFG_0856 [Streptomyces afghaniensis 772]
MPRVWDVPVRDSTRVRDARVAAESAAALAGLDERRTAAAALVATELATNLLKHAEGGQVLIDIVAPPAPREGGTESRVVQIAAIDHGPGIADMPAALRDGFSTTGSLGAGLGTCQRLADDFALHSTPGRGTVAVARVGTTPRGGGGPEGRTGAESMPGGRGPAHGTAVPGASAWSEGGALAGGWWPGGDAHAPVGAVACGALTGHAAAPGGAPGLPGQAGSVPGHSGVLGNEPGPRPDSVVPDGEVRGPGGTASDGRPARRVTVRARRRRARRRCEHPYGGAEYSGDAWAWVRSGDRLTLMLADGLGHGPEAARASSAAVTALYRWAHLTPAESLRRLHDALKGTRGAAVALAQLDVRAGLLRFAGIGNVGARLRADGTWRPLLSRPGIVGVHRPATLREEEADWAADRLLVLHTDGLPSRWTPPSDAGLSTADPAVTAAVAIRDASSPARPVRDDTAVAVLTPTPPGTPMMRTWQITTVTDAARARIALARLAAAYGVPTVERTRLAAALSAQLRQCLTKGGTWLLTLDMAGSPAEEGLLHAVVTPSPDASAAAGEPPWEVTVPCPEVARATESGTVEEDAAALAEALLGADRGHGRGAGQAHRAGGSGRLPPRGAAPDEPGRPGAARRAGRGRPGPARGLRRRAQRTQRGGERPPQTDLPRGRERRADGLAQPRGDRAPAAGPAGAGVRPQRRRLAVRPRGRQAPVGAASGRRRGRGPDRAPAVRRRPSRWPARRRRPAAVRARSHTAAAVRSAADAPGPAGGADPVAARCALGPRRRGDADRAHPAGQHRDRQRPALRAQPRHRRDAATRPAHGPAGHAGPQPGGALPARHPRAEHRR